MGHLRHLVVSVNKEQIKPNMLFVIGVIAYLRVLLASEVCELGATIDHQVPLIQADVIKVLIPNESHEDFFFFIVNCLDFALLSLLMIVIPVINDSFGVILVEVDMYAELLET
jgi:hypothetical protein